MTEEDIIKEFREEALIKFKVGKQEHNGGLEDKPCYKFMKYEIIDLIWYYLYGEKQREKTIAILENILNGKVAPCDIYAEITKAVNLLKSGNTENKQYNE